MKGSRKREDLTMIRQIIMKTGTIALLLIAGLSFEASAQTNGNYKAEPEFISDSVPPNVLLLMDNSGSMNSGAYVQNPFDKTKAYLGVFDAYDCYKFQSNKFVPNPAANPTALGTCGASYPWSGNLLNYATQRRMDIVKWVMIGGNCSAGSLALATCTQLKGQDVFDLTACCVDIAPSIIKTQLVGLMDSAYIPSLNTDVVYFHHKGSDSNFIGRFCMRKNNSASPTGTSQCTGGLFDIKADIAPDVVSGSGPSPTGVVQKIGKKARFGLMEFNSAASGFDGGNILADVGSAVDSNGVQQSMITAIQATVPKAWTPLSESLYEATRYFAQVAPAYSGSNYTTGVQSKDPYYFTNGWSSPSQYVSCCKSFVMIFTDGSPTQDTRIPPSMQDAAHAVVPHGASNHCAGAGGCTAFHTSGLHPTLIDHHDVCSAYYDGEPGDSCQATGSHYLDDVAFYAHTTDLRPSGNLVGIGKNVAGSIVNGDLPGNNLTGVQNLTVYTFLAFGTGANLLKDTAKVGGFDDVNGNNNGIPDNGATPAGPCLDFASNPNRPCEWDRLNNTTGAATPDGIPDTYFASNDADDLQDRLMAAINSILARSASGTAASVLANSSTGEGALYQAYFYPRTVEGANTIDWTGYVQGFWVDAFGNMREDNGDRKLVYADDKIIKMIYDTSLKKVIVQRFDDTSPADGKADSATPTSTITDIRQINGIWEAGKQLALKTAANRTIWTWADKANVGVVDAGEQVRFDQAHEPDLKAFLHGDLASTGSVFTSTNIIDFILGCEPVDCPAQSSLRYRQLTVSNGTTSAPHVWKLGDAVHSTPTVVGAPKERYDVIYGDESYRQFFVTWKDRRQVAYVGANDGMLHAFNAGYYNRGDDPSSAAIEHGWFSTNRPVNPWSNTAPLGDELWGFVPKELLPHLRWLLEADYSHVYYVDLKPKVTDVRIFCDSTSTPAGPTPCVAGQSGVTHTGGWGTILIGGFRMGGSCGAADCVANANGAVQTMKFSADFDNNAGTADTQQSFYSAYFVLDITDPESPPKLLWSFTDANMGFTTSYPTVLRVKPPCTAPSCNKTDSDKAQWFALFGSGPTNYAVDTIRQGSRLYAFDLVQTPTKKIMQISPDDDSAASTSPFTQSMLGDVMTVDIDLDYRVDVAYAGSLIKDTSRPWSGELNRLTTPCSADPCSTTMWGIAGSLASNRIPTKLISTIGSPGPKIGPVTAGVTVTKDDSNNVWVFFGTGRFYDYSDKTLSEQEYFLGIKDSVQTGCSQTSRWACQDNVLVDVSSASICSGTVCTGNQVTGVTDGSSTPTTLLGTTTSSLQGLVASKKGWFTKLPKTDPAAPRERVLVSPTLFGGMVFFPTFVPQDDLCVALGDGYLYSLFYQTGSAYKDSVIGTDATTGIVNKSISLGQGQVSQLGVHIGAEGRDANGTNNGGGCQGGTSVIGQSSTGAIGSTCVKTQSVWSRYLSWNNQRL